MSILCIYLFFNTYQLSFVTQQNLSLAITFEIKLIQNGGAQEI